MAHALSHVLPGVLALRAFGGVSFQLAYVACGRFDGYWEYGHDMVDWMAGSLLVREANGTVTDMQGNDFSWGASGIIAANPVIQQKLQAEVELPQIWRAGAEKSDRIEPDGNYGQITTDL